MAADVRQWEEVEDAPQWEEVAPQWEVDVPRWEVVARQWEADAEEEDVLHRLQSQNQSQKPITLSQPRLGKDVALATCADVATLLARRRLLSFAAREAPALTLFAVACTFNIALLLLLKPMWNLACESVATRCPVMPVIQPQWCATHAVPVALEDRRCAICALNNAVLLRHRTGKHAALATCADAARQRVLSELWIFAARVEPARLQFADAFSLSIA